MNIEPNETVIRQERVHPGIFALPVLVFLLFVIPDAVLYLFITHLRRSFGQQPMMPLGVVLLILPLVPGLILLLVASLAYLKSEVTLTSHRLLFRTGLIMRVSGELPLENVEGIIIMEPLLGQVFGYGTVVVSSIGGARFPLRCLGKPHAFHTALQTAVAAARKPRAPEPVPNPVDQDDSRYMPRS